MCLAFQVSVPPKALVLQVFMEVRLRRAGHRGGGVNLGKDQFVWEVTENVATTLICAALTAKARMLEHASPLVRLPGQRVALNQDASRFTRK